MKEAQLQSTFIPGDLEAEEGVLGAIMIESDCMKKVSTFLKPEHFYKEAHADIYRSALRLHNDNEPIDLLTMSHELRSSKKIDKVGGILALTEMTERVSSSANIERHALFIKEYYNRREIHRIAYEAIKKVPDMSDVSFDIASKLISEVSQVCEASLKSKTIKVEDYVKRVVPLIGKKGNSRIYTGIAEFDKFVKVKPKTKHIITITGMPSSGKTSVMMDIAKRYAKQGIPVGVVSLEMTHEQLIDRYIVSECKGKYTNHEYDLEEIKREDIEFVQKAMSEIHALPIYINDNVRTVEEISYLISDWQEKHGVQVIFIDYLQKIPPSKSNQTESISHSSAVITQCSKDLLIPIYLISSQTNESQKAGQGKAYSGLKGSGDIAYDSDSIIEVINPTQHNLSNWEDVSILGTNIPTKDTLKLEFKKARNGALGSVLVTAELSTNRIVSYMEKLESLYVPKGFVPEEKVDVLSKTKATAFDIF